MPAMADIRPETLSGLLAVAAARHPETPAIIMPARRITYAALNAQARCRAKSLMALGVQPGDHIGIYLPTCIEWVEFMFGAAMAGAVAIPINARYIAGELTYITENADLVAIVTTDEVSETVNFIERLKKGLPSLDAAADAQRLSLPEAPKLRNVLVMGRHAHKGCIDTATVEALADTIPDVALDARIAGVRPDQIGLILYTSGTTSNPKGCLIPHGAIVRNSRNLGSDRYQLSHEDRFWSPLPIFHIAGILPMVAIMDVGGSYLMMPFFEAGQALDLLEKEQATAAYPCFITIMQDMISHPTFKSRDLSRVRLMNSSFAVQPPGLQEAMQAAMPQAIQVGTYGLSEAAGTICTSRVDDTYTARTTTLGSPLKQWEVRIADPETGRVCAPGEKGEIQARGPNMLVGYYKEPTKTAETIDAEGWLHTGDIGSLDTDGRIMFHGRNKDMLKVGGENVAAAEIEALINRHPAVRLAQVVGVPHERLVEVPAAFVELHAGSSATEQDIIAHCKGAIASFKVPQHVRFVTEWPMSTSKIQKFRLRDTLAAELTRKRTA